MRRSIALLPVAFLMTVVAGGCTTVVEPGVKGSAQSARTPVQVPSFTRLDVESAFVVNLSLGPTNVTLDVSKNVLSAIDVHVSDSTLHIGLKPGRTVVSGTVMLRAFVSTPHLTGLAAGGASIIGWGQYFQSPEMEISASGASMIDGPVEVDRLHIDLAGASHLALQGDAHSLDARVSGASVASILGLKVTNLTVGLSGASHMQTTVVETISAVLSGASSLLYYPTYGEPTFTRKDVSGGSSIQAGP
jgi:Putative auto-transporter adhesin, head GIN domain